VAASRHRPKPAPGAQDWAKRQLLAELEESLAAAAQMMWVHRRTRAQDLTQRIAAANPNMEFRRQRRGKAPR
jgi:hypothetical protein